MRSKELVQFAEMCVRYINKICKGGRLTDKQVNRFYEKSGTINSLTPKVKKGKV